MGEVRDFTHLKSAFRYLLLPIPFAKEEESASALADFLDSQKISPDTQSSLISLEYDKWKNGDACSNILRISIERCLEAAANGNENFSSTYFRMHAQLLKDPFINFDLAVILLTHIRLIRSLAVEEKMSAAKIARVINSVDHRMTFLTWKHIQDLLATLKIVPELKQIEVSQLYEEEKNIQTAYFADAALETSADQIGEVAKRLQAGFDIGGMLKKLGISDDAHLPYLQILHYQCLISAYFDHVFTTPYEFSPRGTVADWLFKKWDNLLHTSNPILNNAKAVYSLDENWARSRKPNEYEQAAILASILKGLDGLGFAAAQELTSWIRLWMIRYITYNTTALASLDLIYDNDVITHVMKTFATKETNTYGIVEQRLLDVCASRLHVSKDGWRPRGLSDSVNANNLSRKKLGDCDFQHTTNLQIVAYEAHGGTLSSIYLEGHLRTIHRALSVRKEELESIKDLSEWHLTVYFVAYEFSKDIIETSLNIDGLDTNLKFITFKQLLYLAMTAGDLDISFNTFFIKAINNRRTPEFVRKKVQALISAYAKGK